MLWLQHTSLCPKCPAWEFSCCSIIGRRNASSRISSGQTILTPQGLSDCKLGHLQCPGLNVLLVRQTEIKNKRLNSPHWGVEKRHVSFSLENLSLRMCSYCVISLEWIFLWLGWVTSVSLWSRNTFSWFLEPTLKEESSLLSQVHKLTQHPLVPSSKMQSHLPP